MEKKGFINMILFVSLVTIFCLTILSLYIMLKSIPKYVYLWNTLGGILPFLTRLVISISYTIRRSFILLLPILFMGFIVCIVLAFTFTNKRLLAKTYGITASLLIIFVLLCALAIKLPLLQLRKILGRQVTYEELVEMMKEKKVNSR